MKARDVREGDVYAVPLRTGGYGIGVVARKSRGGILLGYFFGPRTETLPARRNWDDLSPGDAVLVSMFSHLGIIDESWSRLGKLERWDREQWPVPNFVRTGVLGGRTWRVIYKDDLGTPAREERCSPEEAAALRPDSLAGAGAIEIELTRML